MSDSQWIPVCDADDVPPDGGVCVLAGGKQIAIFNFASRKEWFACQNECPHWRERVLSRGLLGDEKDEPKISCPMHKNNYSLLDGRCLNSPKLKIRIYPVRVEDGVVSINPQLRNRKRKY